MPSGTEFYLENDENAMTITAERFYWHEEYHDFSSKHDYTESTIVAVYSYPEFLEIKNTLESHWNTALSNYPDSCDIVHELERRLHITSTTLSKAVEELTMVLPKDKQSYNKNYKEFLVKVIKRNIDFIEKLISQIN